MSLSFKNKRISSLVAQIQNSGWDLFPKTGIYCFLSIHVAYGTVTEHRQLKCRTHGRQTIIWTDRKIKAKTNILCFLRRRQTLCYSPFWVFFFFFFIYIFSQAQRDARKQDVHNLQVQSNSFIVTHKRYKVFSEPLGLSTNVLMTLMKCLKSLNGYE